MPKSKKKYDLEERTAKFGEDIIKFAKKIPKTPVTSSGSIVGCDTLSDTQKR